MNDAETYPAAPNAKEVHPPDQRLRPGSDLVAYLRQYTRERPEVVALCCIGIGFVLGWKLKPW